MVRGELDEENSLHPGQIIYGQNMENNGKERQAEGEAKVVE